MAAFPSPHHLPSPSLPALLGAADARPSRREAPHAYDPALLSLPDRQTKQWVWHSRFGAIVIEVRGGDVFVNGDRVAPHGR